MSAADATPPAAAAFDAATDPRRIAAIRSDMLRFARLQLGQDDEAEDAVQEALAGALKNAGTFRSEAALKTWIIAILKHKIADVLRQRRRRAIPASQLGDDDEDGRVPALFDRWGIWRDSSRPARWENPEADLHSNQFLTIFDACINRLPPQQGRVFLMREVVELGTEEICAETGLSTSNVHVILHRARLGLRACIDHNWFNPGAQPC